MGVEFCIWLWRMYRLKRKQERLQLRKPHWWAQRGAAGKSNAPGTARPI